MMKLQLVTTAQKRESNMNWNEYTLGVRRGMPVGIGYLSVSFGFGTLAASQGIRVLDAFLISATNVTSAGQFAGLTLILACAGLWEVILTQLIINSRYALMSLALSQRMGEKIGLIPRLLVAFMNTDEIFALAMSRKEPLTVPYLLGLGLLPFLGWTAGTVLGALAGSILPEAIRTALGVMLYGMFIAIVAPCQKRTAGAGRGASGPGVQQSAGLGTPVPEYLRRYCHRHQYGSGSRCLRGPVPHLRRERGGSPMSIYAYIAAMALTTYLIRMLPMTIFRKPIRSRFLRSFLYYVPYACLTAMTFPSILSSAGSLAAGIAALAAAVLLSYLGKSLVVVALSSSAVVFVVNLIVSIL